MLRSGADYTTSAPGLDISMAIQFNFNFNFNDIHVHDQWVAFTDDMKYHFSTVIVLLDYSYLVRIMTLASMVFDESTVQEFYT